MDGQDAPGLLVHEADPRHAKAAVLDESLGDLGKELLAGLGEDDGLIHKAQTGIEAGDAGVLAIPLAEDGDVADDDGGLGDDAGGIADGGDRHGDIEAASILGQAHGLEVADALAPRDAGANLLLLLVMVLGDEAGDGLADHLCGGVTKEALGSVIPVRDDAGELLGNDGVLSGLDDGSEPGPDDVLALSDDGVLLRHK